MTGSDRQALDTESSQTPGLTYGFQGSMNFHRGTGVSAAVTVHRFVFLVFYIRCISKYNIHCIYNKNHSSLYKNSYQIQKIEMNKIL